MLNNAKYYSFFLSGRLYIHTSKFKGLKPWLGKLECGLGRRGGRGGGKEGTLCRVQR